LARNQNCFLSLCRLFRVGFPLRLGDLYPAGHEFGPLDLPDFPAVQVLGYRPSGR